MSRLVLRFVLLALAAAPSLASGYPRIANLWGCYANTTDYDKWARYDLLVTGGAPAAYPAFRREMRRRNPAQIVLGTAPLMNIGGPASTPWMKDEWYLRRPNGDKIVWWADQIYLPNILRDDCLEALVQQTEGEYGEVMRQGVLDGLFYDSVVGSATWLGEVDANGDGVADLATEVDGKWQARQNLFFARLRALHPDMKILANDVDLRHAPEVNGRLFEGAPLLDRIIWGVISPQQAIAELDAWMTASRQPSLTFAIMTHPVGWDGWRVGKGDKVTTPGEVDRARRDFPRMRTGLATALMTDAYYAYDLGTVWYGLPWWYAEYDAPLGEAVGAAREVFEVPPVTVLDWSAGQPATAFVLDYAKATPQGLVAEVTEGGGWRRLLGTTPGQVRLEPGKTYRVQVECQVLRRPSQAFQFQARTGRGGWERHDKGMMTNAGQDGSQWRIDTNIVLDDFDDYALEWHLLGTGSLRVTRLLVRLVGESYLRRDFAGGSAFLNTTPHPVTVRLDRPLRRLKDSAAPRHIVEVDDRSAGFGCRGAWQEMGGESHYHGPGYRLAAKPGDTARWEFTVPSADRYTLFVTMPGGKTLTGAAAYTIRAGSRRQDVTLDQQSGDGGWVKLAGVKLAAGERCEVTLRSGGGGATAADAVRAESAARHNDGAMVTSLKLGPLDGAVLVRP